MFSSHLKVAKLEVVLQEVSPPNTHFDLIKILYKNSGMN